ncbi:hypothetical protein [Psychrobacter lutiphocae]|uniref:hypothetical protein n=1 Tax=Psychrobacter lutiphocae TaxID=540500 RepID=UPI000380263E|nr:hypothetical protein [Psychrobacter lutiphocae]
MFTLPILDIKPNPLDALLAAIGIRLTMLTKSKNPEIQQLLNERKISIEFGSKTDGIARYYVFDTGTFKQYAGTANQPRLRIDFKDSMTGVKLLTAGDMAAFMSAIQDKEMTVEGDYSLLMWFGQLAKYIVPEIPDEVKPLLEKARPFAEKAQGLVAQVISKASNKHSR